VYGDVRGRHAPDRGLRACGFPRVVLEIGQGNFQNECEGLEVANICEHFDDVDMPILAMFKVRHLPYIEIVCKSGKRMPFLSWYCNKNVVDLSQYYPSP